MARQCSGRPLLEGPTARDLRWVARATPEVRWAAAPRTEVELAGTQANMEMVVAVIAADTGAALGRVVTAAIAMVGAEVDLAAAAAAVVAVVAEVVAPGRSNV